MSLELVRLLEITTAVIELLGVSVLVLGFLISVGRYLRHYRHMANASRHSDTSDRHLCVFGSTHTIICQIDRRRRCPGGDG